MGKNVNTSGKRVKKRSISAVLVEEFGPTFYDYGAN